MISPKASGNLAVLDIADMVEGNRASEIGGTRSDRQRQKTS